MRFYSSLVFLINVCVALYYEYYLYAACFLLLTITSLYYHSHNTRLSGIMDKIAIYLVVCYGAYLFYKKISGGGASNKTQTFLSVIIVSSFLATILMYYCVIIYCEDVSTADYYHSMMHCICSLGHVCITVI
jgi:hypothetical protein